jgi:hypothetical protein
MANTSPATSATDVTLCFDIPVHNNVQKLNRERGGERERENQRERGGRGERHG